MSTPGETPPPTVMIEPFHKLPTLLPGSENSCVSFGLPDVLIATKSGQLTQRVGPGGSSAWMEP